MKRPLLLSIAIVAAVLPTACNPMSLLPGSTTGTTQPVATETAAVAPVTTPPPAAEPTPVAPVVQAPVSAPVAAPEAKQGAPSTSLHSPKAGSAERKAILDALRPKVENDLHQKVVFQVNTIRVAEGWAFATGTPLQPNGNAVNLKKTPYYQDHKDGFWDDNFSALFRWQDGAWHVVAWDVGATDVTWIPWADQYHAPKIVFTPLGN